MGASGLCSAQCFIESRRAPTPTLPREGREQYGECCSLQHGADRSCSFPFRGKAGMGASGLCSAQCFIESRRAPTPTLPREGRE